MRYVVSFFTTDIKWKLICLGLAILFWIISFNFNNPTENRSFYVPLEVHNEDILTNAGLVVLNRADLDRQIRVGIRALRREFDVLNQNTDIRASIDFRAIPIDEILNAGEPVTVELNVGINLAEDLEHFSISPDTVELVVDVLASESFSISSNIEGEIAPGFELMPIRLAMDTVTITGPRSLLSDIAEVRVDIDVWGVHEETEMRGLAVNVITHSGEDIFSHLHLSLFATNAVIPVWPVQNVELRVQTTGSLAGGYAVDTVVLEPSEISVVAHPSVLEDVEYILLEIDLDNASTTFAEELSIIDRLPNGIYLRTGEMDSVTATVIVEPIERRVFNVPRDDVRIRGLQAIYQILSTNVNIRVEVAGSRGQISELTQNDIGLELDLRNLPVGIHYVVLNVNLPTGITIFQNAPALQVQIHEPAPDDPDPPLEPPEQDPDSDPSNVPYETDPDEPETYPQEENSDDD